jgi:hypothetical protein
MYSSTTPIQKKKIFQNDVLESGKKLLEIPDMYKSKNK